MAARRLAPGARLAICLFAGAMLLYPALAGAALLRWQPRPVACGVLAIALGTLILRRALEGRSARSLARQSAAGIALLLGAIAWNDAAPLRLFPALVNLQLAIAFGATLRGERSLIERAALAIQPYLPPFTRSYCRKVTAMWAAFFAANTALIAWLALSAPLAWWTLYTSRVYFAIVAVLSIAEFLVRKLFFRHYNKGLVDRVLAAFFPAENTERGRRSVAYLNEMRRLGLKTD